MIIMMTTTELAASLDTTPRTLRKFLRSQGDGVGKGSRYALPSTKRDLARFDRDFAAFIAARTPAPTDDATDTDATD